jgi:hypothetical protein
MNSALPVKLRVEIINEKIDSLKEDFANFIKDKSFPLEERWSVFLKANNALSNFEPFIQHLDTVETLGFHDNGARGDVTAECVIDRFINYYELEREQDGDYSARTDAEWKMIEEKANTIKEELLEKNLKGWLIDW